MYRYNLLTLETAYRTEWSGRRYQSTGNLSHSRMTEGPSVLSNAAVFQSSAVHENRPAAVFDRPKPTDVRSGKQDFAILSCPHIISRSAHAEQQTTDGAV